MSENITIAKLANGWHTLPKINNAVLLIGYGNTGRTTLAELIKKYKFNNPSPGLTFETSKYNLENVIASKSIKLQTTAPVLYENDPQQKDQIKILDVPSYFLAPEIKKWTGLEQKLTVNYTFDKSEKVGFLLFVQEKNTRANVATWKKTLLSFLEVFNGDFTEDLLNSVAMVITKAPSDIKEDTMAKRLKNMQAVIEKQKSFNVEIINKLVQAIINNNRLFIFKKVTGEGTEGEEIVDLANRLEEISNYTINKKHLKEWSWNAEEQKGIAEYLSLVQQCIEYLIRSIIKIITLKTFNQQNISEKKRERPEKLSSEIALNPLISKKFEQYSGSSFNCFDFVDAFQKAKEFMKSISAQNIGQNFEKIMDLLIKFGFFGNEREDLYVFQNIYEGLNFKQIMNYQQFQLDRYYSQISKIFSDQMTDLAFKMLMVGESPNSGKDFYKKSIQLIDQNFKAAIPPVLKDFYEKCLFKLIKFLNPKEALTKLSDMLSKESDRTRVWEVLIQISTIFKKQKLMKEASAVFRYAKCPSEAIQCFKEIVREDEKTAREYILYLTQIYLFSQAKEECLGLSFKFGAAERINFGNVFKSVVDAEKKYFSESIKSNVLLDEIQISGEAFNELKKAISEAISKVRMT